MNNSALAAPSNSSNSNGRRRSPLSSLFSRIKTTQSSKSWKPPALRAPVLILTIAICWSLIAVLQYLLTKSKTDNGIIFASRISDLPLTHTFLYMYFPTIVAVLFSIYWAWIDLETKRMEPYYQLSKDNGALGKDALLLHYPFDFIPLVPLKAFRDRHWPVFWASFAVVLITWGLVPSQAGLFSVQTVSRTTNTAFDISTSYIPAAEQASNLTFRFSQSTYAIASLNETLPPFMARNYTLAPFKVSDGAGEFTQGKQSWTANTTMYFLNLQCDDASHSGRSSSKVYDSNRHGYKFTLGPTGNLTVGDNVLYGNEALGIRKYTGQYAGYFNPLGLAEYSLDHYCPESANQTFFAAFTRNKERKTDPPQNVTAIYCSAVYCQQSVSATVDALTKSPQNIWPIGEKQLLSPEIFNRSIFEELLNTRSLGREVRGDILPAKTMPSYLEPLAKMNVSLTSGSGAIVQAMVGSSLSAISVNGRPLDDLLNWQILSKAYADAYRLEFARAMVEILDNNFRSSRETKGQIEITEEAVLLEEVFVYVVEGLLGVVSLSALALLYISMTRKWSISMDPSTIAGVMAIVADNELLLADFADLDCCTVEDIQKALGQKRFKLETASSKTSIVEWGHTNPNTNLPLSSRLRQNTLKDIVNPVRPREFSLLVAVPFVNLFIVLAIVLGVIYTKAYAYGLPLPSSNTIVQNILENYMLTAIATMIEPMWILINRLLCLLQPIEELRGCSAKAEKSIDLDYSSLPPQLVVFKALKSKHFVLAAVCTMAIFANVLAVAFAGLFNQKSIDIHHSTYMYPPFDLKFVSINGSIGPVATQTVGSPTFSGAYQGGDGEDQFLVAESNYTRNTPLPAWTDDEMFYLPLFAENDMTNNSSHYEAETRAFGAKLDCTELKFGVNFNAALRSDRGVWADANLTIPQSSSNVRCTNLNNIEIRPGPIQDTSSCVTGRSALELIVQLSLVGNITTGKSDVCMRQVILGWIRNPQGSCSRGQNFTITRDNSLFVQCAPRLVTGSGRVRVDSAGRLQQKATALAVSDIGNNTQQMFSNDSVNLIGQSNNYLFQAYNPGWHNDSLTNDFINYFVRRASNSRRLVDPNQSAPTFDDVVGPLNKAYSNLFAIWLGTNKANLLLPRQIGSTPANVQRIDPEQRLFLSTPMFVISEAILGIYIIVAVMVYLRRPGQFLPRLPTSIASVIALFAASSAVSDMKNTSHLNKKGRAKHLESLDMRYGYGSFVGGDGRVHVGIEKTPFVRLRSKTTWLEKKMPLVHQTSGGG